MNLKQKSFILKEFKPGRFEHKLKQCSTATTEGKQYRKLSGGAHLPSGSCYNFILKRDQMFINNKTTRLVTTSRGKLYG